MVDPLAILKLAKRRVELVSCGILTRTRSPPAGIKTVKTQNRIAVSIMIALGTIGMAWTSSSFAVQDQTGETTSEPIPANPEDVSKFLRLQTDEFGDPLALQTASTRYLLTGKNGEGEIEIALEGVIHIADASYYRGFQKRFERYDSVLFESIIKPAKKESSGEAAPTGFQMLQQLSTGTLGLAYQFDEVSYDAENMISADMTMEDMLESLAKRGEDTTTLFSDLLAHIIKKFNEPGAEVASDGGSDEQPQETGGFPFKLSVFTDPDGIMKIRRGMATTLVDSGLLESPFPPSIHQMIVGDRNEIAMSVLEEELKKGKKRIAIFYGVGHMGDFEKRLLEKYDAKRISENWRNAWDLRDGAIPGAPLEGLVESTFRDSFKSKLRQFAKGVTQKRADAAREKAEKEKDEKISAMEKALKALEKRLEEAEKKTEGKSDDKDKNSDQTKSDKTKEIIK